MTFKNKSHIKKAEVDDKVRMVVFYESEHKQKRLD
jgi:hypothetical protein